MQAEINTQVKNFPPMYLRKQRLNGSYPLTKAMSKMPHLINRPAPKVNLLESAGMMCREGGFNLGRQLIKNPNATFLIKVSGDSMINAGMKTGDILVVDKIIRDYSNKVVVASINNEILVKRYKELNGKVYLCPENSNYQAIEIKKTDKLEIWGVVTSVIKPV